MARVQPQRAQAAIYTQGLHRVAGWREYADLLDRASDLARKAMEWGAAGMQAFHIENSSGRHGPFELEQAMAIGSAAVAVRNPAASIIEVLAADSGAVLGRGESGTVVVLITPEGDARPFRTSFQLTGNCEEMAVQLDYLIRESTAVLERQIPKVRGPECWLGKVIDCLGSDVAHAKIRAEHEAAIARLSSLRDNLRSLGAFKQRLATFRMLQRLAEATEKMVRRLAAARAALAEAEQRLSTIVGASNTETETGRLHLPERYASEYPQQVRRRDAVKAEIAEVQKLLAAAASDATARLHNPELRGLAGRPALASLGESPQSWAGLESQIDDGSIATRAVEIEGRVKSRLLPDGWPAQVQQTPKVETPPAPERPVRAVRPADPTAALADSPPGRVEDKQAEES